VYLSGKATEPSYYSALKDFLESYAKLKKRDLEIIVQPKKMEAGIPDFLVRSHGRIVGSIEAKDIPANLNEVEKTKQLVLYRRTYPNLILTDFFSFVLFRNGKKIESATISNKNSLMMTGKVPKIKDSQNVEDLIDLFLDYAAPESCTAKELATELAKRAKQLSAHIMIQLENKNGLLLQIYDIIKRQLLPTLKPSAFSDIYAQTLTYGLFFARVEAKSRQFNRINAYNYLPKEIPLLRRLFYLMQDPSLTESLKWIIDDVVTVLNRAKIEAIVKSFYSKSWSKDTVIHFYETFLAVYDPEKRERRGVYYTPAPVVAYIVRTVQELLINDFGKRDGLADSEVTLLDPAAGTLTFPIMAIKLCYDNLAKQGKAGIFPNLVQDHILRNYFAFEVLFAPYVIAHFKFILSLKDLGCTISNQRFQLYLTNSLEMERVESQQTLFPELEREGDNAHKVKIEPVLVIVGNPPYSFSSDNKSNFIEGLMEDYKKDLNEKNIQPLSDDYIKFLRFAHWKIAEKSGKGIVGMITNNAYLDGLIHRNMRKKLYQAFDRIFVLNLHGDSRIGEKTPDGGKDENVFDIQQGVAIIFLVKDGGKKAFHYADLWGLRESKYHWLMSHSGSNTTWHKLSPKTPEYWFFPSKNLKNYENFLLLSELMPFHRQGVKSHRDWLVVGFDRNEMIKRIENVKNFSIDEIMSGMQLSERYRRSVSHSKKLVMGLPDLKNGKIIEYSYRPFDARYIYYDTKLLDRARPELHKQLGSLFLITRRNSRQWRGTWSFVHITEKLPDIDMKGGVYAFPLVVNEKPNFASEFLNWAKRKVSPDISPEDLLGYIYAILHSNIYRSNYASGLRKNFPRIPITNNPDLFLRVSKIGKELINIHLLSDSILKTSNIGFPVMGNDIIEKVQYDSKKFKVSINDKQFFSGIKPQMWKFEVGGYQICERWLKQRIGRKLNAQDLMRYMKIAASIEKTIELQEQIDILFPQIESDTVKLEIKNNPQRLIN
jgi:hypothetical protein